MPTFRYVATDLHSQPVSGKVRAATATAAALELGARDLDNVQLLPNARPTVTIGRSRLSRKSLLQLTRQLATFLHAGIPVVRTLRMLSRQDSANRLLRNALADMAAAVQRGESFADAASAHPEVFPAYYLGILRAAEITGNVDLVLQRLAGYIERDIEERRKIQSALVYPAIVIVLAIATLVVLTSYVLPKFEDLFASFDAELPLATRMLLGVAHLGRLWIVIFGVPVLLALVAVVVLRTSEAARRTRDRLLLRLPVVGTPVRLAIVERFARMLGPMAAAGIAMPEAIQISAQGLENRHFRAGLLRARAEILRGEGLAAPLAATGLFPAVVQEMLALGEETGTLDHQLDNAADYCASELDFKLKYLVSFFEPALILVVGLIVGFVAVGIVSAIYGIYNQVNL